MMIDISEHGGVFGGDSRKDFDPADFGINFIPHEIVYRSPNFNESILSCKYDETEDVYYIIWNNGSTYYLSKLIKNEDGYYDRTVNVNIGGYASIVEIGKYTPYVYIMLNNSYQIKAFRKKDLVEESSFSKSYASASVPETSDGRVYQIFMNGSYIDVKLNEFTVSPDGTFTLIKEHTLGGFRPGQVHGGSNGVYCDEKYIYFSAFDINSTQMFVRWDMESNRGSVYKGSQYPYFRNAYSPDIVTDKDHIFVREGYAISRYTNTGAPTKIDSIIFNKPIHNPFLDFKDSFGVLTIIRDSPRLYGVSIIDKKNFTKSKSTYLYHDFGENVSMKAKGKFLTSHSNYITLIHINFHKQ